MRATYERTERNIYLQCYLLNVSHICVCRQLTIIYSRTLRHLNILFKSLAIYISFGRDTELT